MSHWVPRITAALALAGALSACAAIWGVEDGILDQPLAPGPDASDVTQPLQDAFVVPQADTNGCDTEQVDEAKGIFVSPGGSTAVNCGSKTVPCSTVQLGIDRVTTVPGRSIVYVDQGKYVENVELKGGGYTIQGGWNQVGDKWVRQCIATRSASAQILPNNGSATVRAVGLAGPVVLVNQATPRIERLYLDPASHQFLAPASTCVTRMSAADKSRWQALKTSLDGFAGMHPGTLPRAAAVTIPS